MTRLKDSTFEDGSLTGTKGGSSAVGSPTLDATGLMKGAYCVSFSAATQYVRYDITASDDIYVTGYLYFTATPAANTRMIYINNGIRLDLRTSGRLRLADAAGTAIGSDSAVLSNSTLYRFGIHWKKATGAGNDGQAEAYVTAAGSPEAAFGTAFATSTTLTQTAQLSRVDAGNTTSPVAAFSLDNIRIDNAAMPAADGTPDLLTDLVAYWKLDEASGSRADSVGSNTLADNNTVTSGTGKISNAALFTLANTEYLSIADNAALSAGNINISFGVWVKMNSKPAGNATIIGKWNYSGGTREYTIGYDGTADRLYIQVSVDGTNTGATKVDANNLGSPSTGTWYYIFAWHDAAANTLNISVNDGTVNSSSHTTGIFESSSNFNLGAMNNGGDLWWDGYIDEVGIWKRILTSTEITFLYNSGTGRTHPFASSTDTPKTITVTVSGTAVFGNKAIGKPIAIASAVTKSVQRAINVTKSISSAITTAVSKARALTFSVTVGNVLTAGKGYAKTIALTVGNVLTAGKGYAQTFTVSSPVVVAFAKGIVNLKTITVTVGKSVSVLKNIGKPITSAVTAIASRNINQPKTIQVSLVGIPSIQKNIGKPITVVSNIVKSGVKSFEYIFSVIAGHSLSITKNILKPISVVTTAIASLSPKSIGKTISTSVGTVVDVIYGKSFFIFATVVSNTNLFSQKVIGKTIATVTTIQPSLQKGIDKVIVVAANTSASIRRNIAMTFTTISDAIAIAGRNYPMIISLVVTTAATLGSKAISKVILYTSNVTATVRKGFALTFEVVSEVIPFITKITGTEFVYAQMNKNVRRIAIGVKNTAIDILGINRRSITLKDKEDDNS